MFYKPVKITEIRKEGREIKTFLFDETIQAEPGQFVMVWVPGIAEKPFSISYQTPFGITVKRRGPFTSALFELKEGDTLWVRGPYGNGFPVDKLNSSSNVYIVGGGIGTAPLAFLAEKLEVEVVSFLGAKSYDEIIFEGRFRRVGETHVITEDGSRGDKGVVTDLIRKYQVRENSKAAVCGPEKMLSNTSKILESYLKPGNIYISLERYMKCGRGLCGSCECGGYRVCVDGPVFSYEQLKIVEDFGNFRRDRAGKKCYEI